MTSKIVLLEYIWHTFPVKFMTQKIMEANPVAGIMKDTVKEYFRL